jgi:hypothetical protein
MTAPIPKLPDISYIDNLDHLDKLCHVRDNAITYCLRYDSDDPRHAHGRKAWSMAFDRLCQLSAEEFNPQSDVERDCMVALAAYEQVLEEKHGKRIKATYIRRSIRKNGIIEAISSTVLKGDHTDGFKTLLSFGKSSFAFENVVLKYTDVFDESVSNSARKTLEICKI